MVLNDEAHHTHDEDNEWNQDHSNAARQDAPAAQLDFSATPRFTKGAIFPWTISDYPLKQAILDGIVKRPMKGIAQIAEAKSDYASVRYQGLSGGCGGALAGIPRPAGRAEAQARAVRHDERHRRGRRCGGYGCGRSTLLSLAAKRPRSFTRTSPARSAKRTWTRRGRQYATWISRTARSTPSSAC